jgi:glycosyltransferase involved in cell wall biosynthesis
MSWYDKYTEIYNRPFDEPDRALVADIRAKVDKMQSDKPLASVVAIARNESSRLASCVWSLAENECDYPVELICVDNNSTDDTAEVIKALGVKYMLQPEPGHGNARQWGLEHARGKYYLTVDADTIYPCGYLQKMIGELEKRGTTAVVGMTGFFPDKKNSRAGIALYQIMRDVHLKALFRTRPELCVRGMAFGFSTAAGLKYGFRTDIRRGEDGSMLLSLKAEGGKFKLVTGVRCVTEPKTDETGRSLAHNFMLKLRHSLGNLSSYFRRRERYEDLEGNMRQ